MAVEIWFWGMAYLTWVVFTWWAAPMALLQMFMARQWLLVETAYDLLHRGDLYKELRWQLPKGPEKERESGNALTAYLWRGTCSDGMRYVTPAE